MEEDTRETEETKVTESGEHRVQDPCEGCTKRIKIRILAESGEHRVQNPCEGCTKRSKLRILAESGGEFQKKSTPLERF